VKACEESLEATSTHHAPWYVVPQTKRRMPRLIVSATVLYALNELKRAYPKKAVKHRAELQSIGSSWQNGAEVKSTKLSAVRASGINRPAECLLLVPANSSWYSRPPDQLAGTECCCE
jgi:Polyphosphate kinase 2 (PPK2)